MFFLEGAGKDDGEPVLKRAKFQFNNSSPSSNNDLKEYNESNLKDKLYPLDSTPDVAKHNDNGYQCEQCEFVTKRAPYLKSHKEAKHEKVIYSCDQCDYVAKQRRYLKRHKESKHEGIRYPCDQCDHVATTAGQ